MKIQSVPVKQHKKTMYLASLRATDIVELLRAGKMKVDIWSPDHKIGYQRTHSVTRSKAFGRFIAEANNMSPSSILLCIREDGTQLQYSNGFLTIPDDKTLWLTDGQHRAKGLMNAIEDYGANIDDIELPVVIVPTDGEYEEAKQFVIMNKTQKGVKTDLAERFLQQAINKEGLPNLKTQLAEGKLPRAIFADMEWRPRAVEIADELNANSEVWKGRIRSPNVSQLNATVSQKSLTDSLKPILTHPDFKDLPKDLQIKIIDNYWLALKDIVPNAFINPQGYVIQKTTGTFVLNGVLPIIVKYCKDPNTGKYDLTRGKLDEVLRKIADSEYVRAEAWQASDISQGIVGGRNAQMGTSAKSFSIMRDFIVTELENAMVETEEVRGRVEV